jgi:hypothetical protein
MMRAQGIWGQAARLALAGGLAFWLTNFAISLTPIAAEYRAALSISYLPMLLESLLGGLLIGFCAGYSLLRFFHQIPGKKSSPQIRAAQPHRPDPVHPADRSPLQRAYARKSLALFLDRCMV